MTPVDHPDNRVRSLRSTFETVRKHLGALRSTQKRRNIFTFTTSIVIAIALTPALSLTRIGWFEVLTAAILGSYLAGLHVARVTLRNRYNAIISLLVPTLVSSALWLALSYWPDTCATGCTVVDRAKWALLGALYAITMYALRFTMWPWWLFRKIQRSRRPVVVQKANGSRASAPTQKLRDTKPRSPSSSKKTKSHKRTRK